jgi:hypothetical protein
VQLQKKDLAYGRGAYLMFMIPWMVGMATLSYLNFRFALRLRVLDGMFVLCLHMLLRSNIKASMSSDDVCWSFNVVLMRVGA